jgi:hypothetical protein
MKFSRKERTFHSHAPKMNLGTAKTKSRLIFTQSIKSLTLPTGTIVKTNHGMIFMMICPNQKEKGWLSLIP